MKAAGLSVYFFALPSLNKVDTYIYTIASFGIYHGDSDGDGSENITQKGNSRCIKILSYSTSFNLSIVSEWSWFLLDCTEAQKKEKLNSFLLFTSFIKRKIRRFHFAVVQQRQGNVQKTRDARAELISFANLNLLRFLLFSLPSPLSLLKLPNITGKVPTLLRFIK